MRKSPERLDAWAAYQRGLWHLSKFTFDDTALAEKFFQQAIDLDPGFSGGYVGLAIAQCQAADVHIRDRLGTLSSMEALARRAVALDDAANFGVSDRRFRFKPAGGFGVNRQAVSVQIGTPLRMGFGPDFGEPPLRDTSYLALVGQSKYSCHYYSFE